MSRYLYSARIAPCAETWREAIRNSVVFIEEGGRPVREIFRHDAFLQPAKPVPVVLSHDDNQPVGRIQAMVSHGGWWIADFTLDHSRPLSAVVVDRLKVGTPVSIGFRSLKRDKLLAEDGYTWHTLARLDELSILAPDETPAFRGAKITKIHELGPTKPKPSPHSARAGSDDYVLKPGEEWIVHTPRVLVRQNIGQVTAVGGRPVAPALTLPPGARITRRFPDGAIEWVN